jgi:hypothetical protein
MSILDLDQIEEVEQRLHEKLASRLFNAMTLGRLIQMAGPVCEGDAANIIKNAEGDVLKEVEALREDIARELTS